MKSSSSIPARDLELLSALLDGQLNEADGRALEKRLERDPELRRSLAELRRVREALRALPPVRPPRNFTLTPAMAGQAPARPARGLAYAWGAALASLTFVLVAAADLVGGGFLAARQAAPAAELHMAPALMAAPSEPEARGAADSVANATAPAAPLAAPTATEANADLAKTGILGAGATASGTSTPALGAQEKYASPTATPVPPEVSSLRSITAPPPSTPTVSEIFLAPPAGGEMLGPGEAASAATSNEVIAPAPWLNLLRLLEALLAIVALALSVAAIRARRRR